MLHCVGAKALLFLLASLWSCDGDLAIGLYEPFSLEVMPRKAALLGKFLKNSSELHGDISSFELVPPEIILLLKLTF